MAQVRTATAKNTGSVCPRRPADPIGNRLKTPDSTVIWDKSNTHKSRKAGCFAPAAPTNIVRFLVGSGVVPPLPHPGEKPRHPLAFAPKQAEELAGAQMRGIGSEKCLKPPPNIGRFPR